MYISTTCENWTEGDAVDLGLLANEMLGHDVYSLPESELLGVCQECDDLASDLSFFEARYWARGAKSPGDSVPS